MNTGH